MAITGRGFPSHPALVHPVVSQIAASVPPLVDVAQLILDQYGFGSAFQQPSPVEEINPVAGTGNLTFGGSATGYTTAYVTPPQVTPAELILQQYGLDGALFVSPLTQVGAQFAVSGAGNLDFEASSTIGATAYSVPPQVDVAQLILDQYGLGAVFQVSPTEEINPVVGTGSLTFGASAAGYTSAYSVQPQVDVAQLILDQYGLGSVFHTQPVEEINPVAGTGNLTFNATANIVGAAMSSAPLVDIATVILAQYGLGSAFQQPPPVEEINPVVGTGQLTFGASASAYTTGYATPAQVTPAELILQQYGLDSVLYTPPATLPVGQVAASGTGNLDFEASSTIGTTAYATPALADIAQLILDQYGLGSAFAPPPPVEEINRVAGAGNLDFEASSTIGATAYPTPAPITAALLILQQYGLEQALQVVQGSQALYVAAGGGNLDFEASATAGFSTVTLLPAQATPAEIILAQYGLEAAFQQPPPGPPGGVPPKGLPGLVAPAGQLGRVAPSELAGLVSPTEKGGVA